MQMDRIDQNFQVAVQITDFMGRNCITIMGGQLIKKKAKVARLKKKDFKQPDRTPCTYDRKKFNLHGIMVLEITFGGKMLFTSRQMLTISCCCLKELGILQYHKNVWPSHELVTDVGNTSGEGAVTLVRTFHVSLLEPVIIPAYNNKSAVRTQFLCMWSWTLTLTQFHCCLKEVPYKMSLNRDPFLH